MTKTMCGVCKKEIEAETFDFMPFIAHVGTACERCGVLLCPMPGGWPRLYGDSSGTTGCGPAGVRLIAMRMPFGKYRGKVLNELPSTYIAWLSRLQDLREPLRSAVWRELETRRDAEQEAELPAPHPELCPDPGIALEIVGAGLRALALKAHPDKGGDVEDMKRLNVVAEWLRRKLRGVSA